ncbi:MAG TPA: threonine-phosphate decarboxylase [Clostridiales bacterium]|nr:threonine-phosphate decarboxylase [Clostridiales bacterium]
MEHLTHGGDIYSLPHPDTALDFSSNSNPLGIHTDVKRAVIGSIEDCTRYPDPLCRELTAAISEREGAPARHIVCGNGAADLIYRLVQLVRPKNALLPSPAFSEYESALRGAGCRIEYARLAEADGFTVTERILKSIRQGLDILFLCNPNNPTGLLADPALMLRILEQCARCGTLLVADECFNGFVDEPQAHSLKRYLRKYKNLFILKAFTKLYAIPGLRLGYGLCADEKLAGRLRRCGQAWSVSIPAQAAGVAVMGLHGYEEQTRAFVAKQREWLKKELSALGFTVYDSAANYLFARCGESNLKAYLITKNILIRDCADYRGLKSGYYRFAVLDAHKNQILARALKDAVLAKEVTL